MRSEVFEFNGYQACVAIPDNFNGKWIWKTEFFTAFDKAERELFDKGYARVYYQISDKYGSYGAVRLMHNFYLRIVKEFGLDEKCILFGFSRGGLYAFDFALFYPEVVEKIYFDAPVFDMRTWPPKNSVELQQLFAEYSLNEQTLEFFTGHPVLNFKEFFSHKIPVLLIAGDDDEEVPFPLNAGKMISFCSENNIKIEVIIKKGAKHHPHSLEDVSPIIKFVEERNG